MYKSKIIHFILYIILGSGLILGSSSFTKDAFAQEKINVQAYAIDGATLRSKNMIIQLWGIDPLIIKNTVSGLKARVRLDDLIDDRPVSCSIIKRPRGKIIAQCMNAKQQDLSYALIESGLAIVNRGDIVGSDFQKPYSNAEKRARLTSIGLWKSVGDNGAASSESEDTQSSSASTSGSSGLVGSRTDYYILLGAIVLGPIVGLVIVGFLITSGLGRLVKLQKHQIALARQKERALQEREKFVLASSLEGEINTNRAKIDAFLLIYEDLLKNLRDPSKTPKYKAAGDIIHQKPSLSRSIYDANVDKLDILGTQIMSELSQAYLNVEANPNYITLEPETPIDQAVDQVQKIIQAANNMIEPLDTIGSALSMILRDRKAKMPRPASSNI